jgi:hypothetical protein
MNFGDEVVEVLLADDERLVWASEASARDEALIHLPRWTGAIIAVAR